MKRKEEGSALESFPERLKEIARRKGVKPEEPKPESKPEAPAPEPAKDGCVACGGTGKSSNGKSCIPCHGTGKKTQPAPKAETKPEPSTPKPETKAETAPAPTPKPETKAASSNGNGSRYTRVQSIAETLEALGNRAPIESILKAADELYVTKTGREANAKETVWNWNMVERTLLCFGFAKIEGGKTRVFHVTASK